MKFDQQQSSEKVLHLSRPFHGPTFSIKHLQSLLQMDTLSVTHKVCAMLHEPLALTSLYLVDRILVHLSKYKQTGQAHSTTCQKTNFQP